MTRLARLLALTALGCGEPAEMPGEAADDDSGAEATASGDDAVVPSEGLWRLTSFTDNENSCTGVNFAPLETAELGEVTANGFKLLLCFDDPYDTATCPAANSDVVADGIDCSLDDGAFACSSVSSVDIDGRGTMLDFDQAYSGAFSSPETLTLHRVSHIDCRSAPDNEGACDAYFAGTVFPCVWDFSSSFER